MNRNLAGRQFGAFEVVSLLGVGGMGEVYRARDLKLGRDVAIKIISANVGHDPVRRSRFEREARLLASLNHPNIAAIHAVEEIDDSSALAYRRTYDVLPDGKFVVIQRAGPVVPESFVVVLNALRPLMSASGSPP